VTSKRRWKYYHCRDRGCGVKTIPEPVLEEQMIGHLKKLEFTDKELVGFKQALVSFRKNSEKTKEEQMVSLDLELSNIETRLTNLMDKFIAEKVDDETYAKARTALLNRQIELREYRDSLEKTDDKAFKDMNELGKLLRSPALAYKNADTINKRRLIVSMVENLKLDQKTLIIEWKKPFDMVAKRPFHNTGVHLQPS